MSTQPNDHGLLVTIAQSLARLESKVDGLDKRLDTLDRRLDDHEDRLRAVEADYVSEAKSVTSRRWLVGVIIAATVTIAATWLNILFG